MGDLWRWRLRLLPDQPIPFGRQRADFRIVQPVELMKVEAATLLHVDERKPAIRGVIAVESCV